MMKEQEEPPPDQSDWEDEPEDDWGDAPDEDPESVPSTRFWTLGMVVLWIVLLLLLAGLLWPFLGGW